jgi:FKBP-type peptidyl-prolyl cis-trans isomerase
MKTIFSILLTAMLALALVGCQSQKPAATSAPVAESPAETKTPEPSQPTVEKPSAAKDGTITTPSGLKYKDKKVGKGPAVMVGNTVLVHYKGWLDSGKVFDTSKKPGREPFSFTVGQGQVIKGWEQGLIGMQPGGVRELTIPAELGYGDQDMGQIPPNSTLHFEIELLQIAK